MWRARTGELLVEVKTLVVLNDPAYGTERSYNVIGFEFDSRTAEEYAKG